MIADSAHGRTLDLLIAALDSSALSYHLTGGVAAVFYGEPRSIMDIDIVLQSLHREEAQVQLRMDRALGADFVLAWPSSNNSAGHLPAFRAFEKNTLIKIDFYARELIVGELSRSVMAEVAPGITYRLVSREDSILSKLYWVSKKCYRSRRDVVMMLRNPLPIDWPALRQRARELQIEGLLDELLARSKQPDQGEMVEY